MNSYDCQSALRLISQLVKVECVINSVLSLSAVFSAAAIIPCCKADPEMSSNGDLSDLGSSDSFWEVQ